MIKSNIVKWLWMFTRIFAYLDYNFTLINYQNTTFIFKSLTTGLCTVCFIWKRNHFSGIQQYMILIFSVHKQNFNTILIVSSTIECKKPFFVQELHFHKVAPGHYSCKNKIIFQSIENILCTFYTNKIKYNSSSP